MRVLLGFGLLAAGVLFGAQIYRQPEDPFARVQVTSAPARAQPPAAEAQKSATLAPDRTFSPRLPAFATEVVAPRAASPVGQPAEIASCTHLGGAIGPGTLRPLRRLRCPRLNPRSRLGPWWLASMPAAFPAKSALLNRVTMRRAASSCAACKPRCGGSDAMKASCLASGRPAPNARWAPLSRV